MNCIILLGGIPEKYGDLMKKIFTLLAFMLSICGGFASTTLFYDGFESDDLNTNWTPTGVLGSYWRQPYGDPNDPLPSSGTYYFVGTNSAYITSNIPISTVDKKNIGFNFKMAAAITGVSSCQAQYSTDAGANWNTVAEIQASTGNAYVQYNITLPAAAENIANLLIRFKVNGTADFIKVDEVYVVDNPPSVNAGVNESIRLPTSTASLSGTATDGTHTPPVAWTLQSNPPAAVVSIDNANSLSTGVSGLTVVGDYVFRLTATDTAAQETFDEVTITVNTDSAPVVTAGVDMFVTLPATTATLFGMATDSGGSIVSREWTKTSGPAVTLTLTGANTNTLGVSGLTATGEYVFTFRATDNSSLSSSDTVKVTVLPAATLYPTFNNIPNAVGMAIDDLGWKLWVYQDSLNTRDATVADYQVIMNVGEAVGTRIMTAWIMCDMDRNFICAKPEYNTPYKMTADGTSWDNRWHYYPTDYDLMNLVKEKNAFMEFGLHGASHIHPIGNRSRTDQHYPNYMLDFKNGEYADVDTDPTKSAIAWGWDDMRNRARCFQELVRQYFTAEEMYFPESFVPPGHAYNYGNNSSQSTGALLNTFGIKYVNGNTEVSIPDLILTDPNLEEGYTDHGVVFMDRALGADYWAENTLASPATPWYGESPEFPLVPLEPLVPPNSLPNYPTDAYGWIEAHFPNYWEYSSTPLTDPNSTYNRWVTYLKGINNNPERMLPKNSEACTSQWFYQRYAGVAPHLTITGAYILTVQSNPLLADYMPEQPYTWNLLGSVTIKTPLPTGKHISSASIDNGAQVVGYYEDTWGYGYLIIANPANPMGRLNRGIYTLTSTLGDKTMSTYVDMTLKTFNVYGFTASTTQPTATVTLKMYGTQDVKVKTLFVPNNVSSDNPYLKINYWTYTYDALGSFITINVTGRNMNGETGTLTISQVSDIKVAAKAELAADYAKYAQGGYSADNWAILTGYITSGNANIDAKADEDVAGIETAKRAAINGMASVQTLAQTLAAAKTSAKAEIGASYSTYYEINYTPADWTTLKGYKASGDTNVEAATSVASVNTAKNTALSGMDGVTRFLQSVVTFVEGDNGSVTWTGIKSDLQQWVNTGTSCLPVTAIPDANYFFSGWSGGATGTANPLSVIVNSNMTITANFSNMYALTVNGGSAILNSAPITSASYGTTGITISANAPPSGQTFVAWIGDTANVANVNLSSTTITSMPASNVTITATYKTTSTKTYTLSVTNGSGDGTYADNTVVNIVAVAPSSGQLFNNWTGDTSKVGNVNSSSTTITMTKNSSVTATYKSTCTLTYTAGAHGTISPTGAQTVAYGGDGAAVTPTPAAGYRFVDWTDGKTDDPRTDRNVTGNISVTANFGIGLYTLTYTAGANGTISGTNTQTVTYSLSGTAVTAVPNTGCTFTKWSDNVLTATRTATNVRADSTVMAIFSDKKSQHPGNSWGYGACDGCDSCDNGNGNERIHCHCHLVAGSCEVRRRHSLHCYNYS